MGLACGLYVLFRTALSPTWNEEFFRFFLSLMILIGLADLFDGAIARLLRVESLFGIYLDSFSDMISFGLCPIMILLKSFQFERDEESIFWGTAAGIMYAVCGMLRLIKYTIQAHQRREIHLPFIEKEKLFTGLPIPAAASALLSLHFLLSFTHLSFLSNSQAHFRIIFSAVCLLGYFMISRWKFPSLKSLNFHVPSFHFACISVLLAIFLLYGMLHHFPMTFFLLSWSYILIPLGLSLIRLCLRKRSLVLVDFDLEEEEEIQEWERKEEECSDYER